MTDTRRKSREIPRTELIGMIVRLRGELDDWMQNTAPCQDTARFAWKHGGNVNWKHDMEAYYADAKRRLSQVKKDEK